MDPSVELEKNSVNLQISLLNLGSKGFSLSLVLEIILQLFLLVFIIPFSLAVSSCRTFNPLRFCAAYWKKFLDSVSQVTFDCEHSA